jgi:hypothetical protein
MMLLLILGTIEFFELDGVPNAYNNPLAIFYLANTVQPNTHYVVQGT